MEIFANPAPERDYTIRMTIPEFSCLCPKTGQPDFATLKLEYVPNERCVELKSLKLYIWSFRNRGAFHEAVTNEILGDLVAATSPRFMRLLAEFNVRGGIYTTVSGRTPAARLGLRPPDYPALRAARIAVGAALHAELAGICFSIIGLDVK